MRQNHIVNKATCAGNKWIGESRFVLGFFGSEFGRIVFVFAENNLDRAFGTHHGNFGVGPRKIHVTAQVLGCHHIVGTTVGFAGDDGNFRHGAFGIGVEQFCAMLDDAAVLLAGAGHEAGNVQR